MVINSGKRDAIRDEIRNAFQMVLFNNGKNALEEARNIANRIRYYQNLLLYEEHFYGESKQIKERVDTLFCKYSAFLDFKEGCTSPKKFAGNYGDKVFELVMADFITRSESFRLKKREGEDLKNDSLPDLESDDEKSCFLECTTRSS